MPSSSIVASAQSPVAVSISPVVTVLTGAFMTAIVGNWLVQNWQQRNWLRQQLYASYERDFSTLKTLADDIAEAMSSRLQAMRQLNYDTHRGTGEQFAKSLDQYRIVLEYWNKKLPVFFKNITLYAKYEYTYYLENMIHAGMVSSGRRLEQAVRNRNSKVSSPHLYGQIDGELNRIQGMCFNLNRDILKYIQDKDFQFKFGRKINYSPCNLDEFTNIELIKALFVSRIELHAILRSPLDLPHPGGGN